MECFICGQGCDGENTTDGFPLCDECAMDAEDFGILD